MVKSVLCIEGVTGPSALFHRVKRSFFGWTDGARGLCASARHRLLGWQLVETDYGFGHAGSANMCQRTFGAVNELVNVKFGGGKVRDRTNPGAQTNRRPPPSAARRIDFTLKPSHQKSRPGSVGIGCKKCQL